MPDSVPFALYTENNQECLCLHAVDGTYLTASTTSSEILGATPEELLGLSFYAFLYPEDAARIATLVQVCAQAGTESSHCLVRFRHKESHYVWLDVAVRPILDANQHVIQFSTRSRQFSTDPVLAPQSYPLLSPAERLPGQLVAEIRYQFTMPEPQFVHGNEFVLWHATVIKETNEFLRWNFFFPDTGTMQRFLPLEIPSGSNYVTTFGKSLPPEDKRRKDAYGITHVRAGRSYCQEFRCRRADGDLRFLREYVLVETIGPDRWKLTGTWTDITEHKQHFDILTYMLSEAHCLIWYADMADDEAGKPMKWRSWFLDEAAAQRFLPLEVPPGSNYLDAWYRSRVEEDSLHTDAYCIQEMRAGRNYHQEYACRSVNGEIRWISEYVNVEVVGTGQWKLVGLCTDVTQRRQAEMRVQHQYNLLRTLNFINSMIAACFDVHQILHLVLENVVRLLAIDAADILRYNARTHRLEYETGQGFQNKHWGNEPLLLGEGLAGRAGQTRTPLYIPDGRNTEAPVHLNIYPFVDEGFIAYAAIPMIARGQMVGVLELLHRAPLEMNAEWHSFVEMIAAQAAIAIDNAVLFEKLQKTNADLSIAYDATIEGWSRILDLRDKETEGHSQRVTEMTLRLARALAIPKTDLLHIRYGALLHDIGKMGIPDNILLKPNTLEEEDWVVMRKHPEYAYNMLRPITFLRPALDIPYCHHEKWDGSGYPRGLKGEQIPLAARIFAVIDVWDALRSDRPYRPALPVQAVREHIRSIAGTHLDPAIVQVFLSMDW